MLSIHRHAAPYLAIVIEGRYEESSIDGVWVCEAGDVVLHPAWHLHANRFAGQCRVLNVVLDRSSASRLVSPAGVWRAAGVARLVANWTAASATVLRQVLSDAECRPAAAVPAPLAAFLEQLSAAPGCGVGCAAARAHLSREHASRLFRRQFGLLPRAFQAEARFRAALALLTSTRMPLADVAYEAGYADQAHLTRSFRAVTRSTPGALRRDLARSGQITFVQ